jgi:dTDP-4-amino-4,6-dideoxygalactose transaminase
MNIPLLNLKSEYEALKSEIDQAISNCLESQQWILGPEVATLESSVAELLNCTHCIGTSSGTEALVLALRALSIVKTGEEFFRRDDKFIVPALTFAATGEAVLRAGGTPVVVDVDPLSYTLDPEKVAECLNTTKGVRGILPVHLYGYPADMQALMKLAREHDLYVVEDVAQAFGGTFNQKPLGTLGDIGAISFFPSKLLGAYGDAGMMATDDVQLAEVLRMLIRHGGKTKYNVEHVGYNARLDTIQAAILAVKLKYLEAHREKRREIAKHYLAAFSEIEALQLPCDPHGVHQYHQFTLKMSSQRWRDTLQRALSEAGIGSAVYYPVPLHKMHLFQKMGTTAGDLSISEELCQSVLSIPIDPYMSNDSSEFVVQTISTLLSQ